MASATAFGSAVFTPAADATGGAGGGVAAGVAEVLVGAGAVVVGLLAA